MKKKQNKPKKFKNLNKLAHKYEKSYIKFFKKYKLPEMISAQIILDNNLEMLPLNKTLANEIEEILIKKLKYMGIKIK